MKFLVIHGPNLNLLGERNPEQYGHQTLEMVNRQIEEHLGENHSVQFFQSNHEGDIIDLLHKERKNADGVIINPGALTHYSYALRDTIEAIEIPCVEVHLSDIDNREEFRKKSVTKEVCIAQVKGKGVGSYLEGVDLLLGYIISD